MAGRTHIAEYGEPACAVGGCLRPAGFATEHVGHGPCRRHDSRPNVPAPEPRRSVPTAVEAVAAVRERRATHGPYSRSPLGLVGLLLPAARKAGYDFPQAWRLATDLALSNLADRRVEEWADVLASTEQAWADAYVGQRSPLAGLDAEVAFAHLPA